MDFEKLKILLDWSFYDNSGRHWFYAILIFILFFFLIKAFQKIFLKRLKKIFEKTRTPLDDFIIDTLGATKSFFIFVVSIYAGSLALKLPPSVRDYIQIVTIIVFSPSSRHLGKTIYR